MQKIRRQNSPIILRNFKINNVDSFLGFTSWCGKAYPVTNKTIQQLWSQIWYWQNVKYVLLKIINCYLLQVSKRSTRHQIRDFFTIMSHNAQTLIRGRSDVDNVYKRRRLDSKYFRTARKAVQYEDLELALLGEEKCLAKSL